MIQCKEACHDKLYDDKDMVDKMLENIDEDLKVPSELVPKCPRCGEDMEPNLRKDGYFVQDDLWYKQNQRYEEFIQKAKGKKVVLLEFGVGFNTPGIFRFSFEQMTSINENWTLIRFNQESKCMYGLTDEQVGYVIDRIKAENINVATGEFGADMQIELQNDGPFTICLNSKDLI